MSGTTIRAPVRLTAIGAGATVPDAAVVGTYHRWQGRGVVTRRLVTSDCRSVAPFFVVEEIPEPSREGTVGGMGCESWEEPHGDA